MVADTVECGRIQFRERPMCVLAMLYANLDQYFLEKRQRNQEMQRQLCGLVATRDTYETLLISIDPSRKVIELVSKELSETAVVETIPHTSSSN